MALTKKTIFFLKTNDELVFDSDELRKTHACNPLMELHDKIKTGCFIYTIKFKYKVSIVGFFGKSKVDLEENYPTRPFNEYLKTRNPGLKYCVKIKHNWSGYSPYFSILEKKKK